MNTTQFLLTGWTWDASAIAASMALLGAYFGACGWNRRAWWLVTGLTTMLVILMSPINTLADGYLFSAHMLQHMILLLIVPVFLIFSLPESQSLAVKPRTLGHPVFGWVAGVGAMWFWHEPALCNAAVSSRPIHAVQTVSLILFGTLFWRQIIAPQTQERLSPPAAVLYLFTACVTCSILGIIITFSPVAVCSIYNMPNMDRLGLLPMIHNQWSISAERDQQLGGLLMWVPMCLIYLAAIFAQLARWFAPNQNLGGDAAPPYRRFYERN